MAAETSIPLDRRIGSSRPRRTASRAGRRTAGRWLIALATVAFIAIAVLQAFHAAGATATGFANVAAGPLRLCSLVDRAWRRADAQPRGSRASRALRPAGGALHPRDGDLSDALRILHRLHRLESELARRAASSTASTISCTLIHDPFFWNALGNMVFYVLAIAVEYAIAFGLALLLNQEIRARRFFRVVFLIPFMLSPVAVSWMIGKSMLEYRFGPVAHFARMLGWDNPAFFASPVDRAHLDRGAGRLGLDPLHHDPAACRPAGDAEGSRRGGEGRRRRAMAGILEDHFSADAAGQRSPRSCFASSSS